MNNKQLLEAYKKLYEDELQANDLTWIMRTIFAFISGLIVGMVLL